VIARLKTNPESEIHLGDALERLRKACPQATNAEEKHGRHDRDVDGRELRATLEQIEAALGVIQNNASWKEWNRFGMAIWNATGGAGFAAFDRWSQKSAEYDAKTTADRWAHFFRSPPDRIGAGSIFFAADQARPGWRDEKRKQEKQSDSADQGA